MAKKMSRAEFLRRTKKKTAVGLKLIRVGAKWLRDEIYSKRMKKK